jgi:nicotinamidase-related amidase
MGQALLVMDFQNGVVARLDDRADQLLDTVERVIAVARQRSIPIVFVRVAFRPGAPEISARNKTFAALLAASTMGEDSESTQIHSRLSPQETDVVILKRRVSAFAGSDLDVVLRALDIDHLILTGIATSGVVLSTTRQAADLDYAITIVSDACADADPEVHRILVDKVFPRQATVVNSTQWTAST